MQAKQIAVRAMVGLAIGLAAGSASAQLGQYIPAGSLGRSEVSTKEAIEKAVADARWKFGGLRVQPWFGIRDVSYVDNVFGEAGEGVSDLTATAGAGLRAYLPVGGNVTLEAHVLPEYTWWQDQDALAGTHVNAGAGLFAYFNRLTIEARFISSDLQQRVSSEIELPAELRSAGGNLAVDLDLAGPFGFFAGLNQARNEYRDERSPTDANLDLPLLDRDETILRGGIRYERGGFYLGLGAQRSETDFELDSRDRSNQGEGPLLALALTGNRISASVDAAYLKLEGTDDTSQFSGFQDLSGRLRLELKLGSRLRPSVYAAQHVLYTLAEDSSHAVERRLGGSFGFALGWRTTARVFAETGTSDFEGSGAIANRRDRLRAAGGDLTLEVRRSLSLLVGFSDTKHSSNQGFERSTTALRIALDFGGAEAVR